MIRADANTIARTTTKLCGLNFHSAPVPMWVFDRVTLAFLIVNQAAVAHYGFSRQQFLSMSILDIRPDEDLPVILHATMIPHEHTSDPEYWRHQGEDGRIFPVEITSYEIAFAGRPAELVVAREVPRDGIQEMAADVTRWTNPSGENCFEHSD